LIFDFYTFSTKVPLRFVTFHSKVPKMAKNYDTEYSMAG
jgi:hypothetical protein